jgi:hypothetical protein
MPRNFLVTPIYSGDSGSLLFWTACAHSLSQTVSCPVQYCSSQSLLWASQDLLWTVTQSVARNKGSMSEILGCSVDKRNSAHRLPAPGVFSQLICCAGITSRHRLLFVQVGPVLCSLFRLIDLQPHCATNGRNSMRMPDSQRMHSASCVLHELGTNEIRTMFACPPI